MSGNSEMVERVARAMWAERVRHTAEAHPGIRLEPYDTDWGGKPVAEQNNILGEARAAIEAMMEPSISMEAAAVDIEEVAAVDWVNALFATGIGSAQQIIVAGYRAMLSEALSPSLKEQERT